MTAFVIFLAASLSAAALAGTGGWWLRGQWERYRAEVARDRAADERLRLAMSEAGGRISRTFKSPAAN